MRQHRKVLLPFAIVVAILFGSLSQIGCGANDLHKLHSLLNQAANAENAASKTNHSFYEAGVYGVVGSPGAIRLRQRAATVVHDSNEKLIVALNLAKGLTVATFESGKLAVLQALAQAASGLNVGNQAMNLVLQSIAALINQAVAYIELFKSSDLRYVLPRIQSWQISEVSV